MATRAFFALLVLALGGSFGASAADNSTEFAFCPKAKFANCTQAPCTLTPDGSYSCTCKIQTRFSVTVLTDQAQPEKSCVAAGPDTVQSRYAPITAYQICTAEKPVWANCLGSPCTDEKATNEALCLCSPPQGRASPYVIVTDRYKPRRCTGDSIYSSATLADSGAITTFLQLKKPNLAGPVVLTPPPGSDGK